MCNREYAVIFTLVIPDCTSMSNREYVIDTLIGGYPIARQSAIGNVHLFYNYILKKD